MTVSSEPRRRRVVLPDVAGLLLRDAAQVLRNSGIPTYSVRYTETYARELEVVETSPRGGQLVEPGRPIELLVSRRSLVNFLPQIYQQQATDPAAFLRGFLYIVQHVADGPANRLDRVHELFDPRTADDEFLPWLASWLAVTLSPDWDALDRRKMLLAATRLFPYRGTAFAIREFVRIYTGADAVIEENTWPFIGFRIGVASTIGLDTVILPPMNLAHCFVVRLQRPASQVDDGEIIKIHHIIGAQKPAHTTYFLAFSDEEDGADMRTFMTVGASMIGMDPEAVGAPAVGMGIGAGVADAIPEAVPPGSAVGEVASVEEPRARRQRAGGDRETEEAGDGGAAQPAEGAERDAKAADGDEQAGKGEMAPAEEAHGAEDDAARQRTARREARRAKAAAAAEAREKAKAAAARTTGASAEVDEGAAGAQAAKA